MHRIWLAKVYNANAKGRSITQNCIENKNKDKK